MEWCPPVLYTSIFDMTEYVKRDYFSVLNIILREQLNVLSHLTCSVDESRQNNKSMIISLFCQQV